MAKMIERHIRIAEELDAAINAEGERRGEKFNQTVNRILWDEFGTKLGQKRAYVNPQSGQGNGTVLGGATLFDSERINRRDGPDPRHGLVRQLIQDRYRGQFKIECPWDEKEAGQLALLLRANPSWELSDMKRMVENRFMSEGVTPERPMGWLKDLAKYVAGPLDRFGKAMVVPAEKTLEKQGVKLVRHEPGWVRPAAGVPEGSGDSADDAEDGASRDRG
jgi:hypothetical protein